jgi:hypothetical protein
VALIWLDRGRDLDARKGVLVRGMGAGGADLARPWPVTLTLGRGYWHEAWARAGYVTGISATPRGGQVRRRGGLARNDF